MSYVYPINLSNDHPLNFINIQKLQCQFKNLDQNDICFAYMYKIPQILSIVGSEKKRLNCHSITALKNYSYLSFEEMRYLNYSKKKGNINLQDPKLISSIKITKYQNVQTLLSSSSNRVNIIDLLSEDEKNQILEYLNLYNSGIDRTTDCLGNGYNHINYSLQQHVYSENQKITSKGFIGGFQQFNNSLLINPIGFQKNVNIESNSLNRNNLIGNFNNNVNNINSIQNNSVYPGGNNLLPNNLQTSSINNNYVSYNNNFNSPNVNNPNFGNFNNQVNINPSFQSQNNPFSNLNNQLNKPNFMNDMTNPSENTINNNNFTSNNINNPLLTVNQIPNTSLISNNNQLIHQKFYNNINPQTAFISNNNFQQNLDNPNPSFINNHTSSGLNNNSNNFNSQNISSNNDMLNKNDEIKTRQDSINISSYFTSNNGVVYNSGKENLFSKLIDRIIINDDYSEKINSINKKSFIDKNQIRGISEIKVDSEFEQELEIKNNKLNIGDCNEKEDPEFRRYLERKFLIKQNKEELIKNKKIKQNKLEKLNSDIGNENIDHNIESKDSNIKLHSIFSGKNEDFNANKLNDKQNSTSHNDAEIDFKIQKEKEEYDENLLIQNEKELKANLLVDAFKENEPSYIPFHNMRFNFDKDFIFIKSNMLNELKEEFEVSRFVNLEKENVNEYNKLIKITIPKNNEYEEFIVFFLTKENADLETIKKVFIHYLKKSILYSLIPEECFMPYLELILLGKNKRAIPQREASRLFLDEIENMITLKDSSIGFVNYKFIELYYLISFSDVKSVYKKVSSLQKECEKRQFLKYNYPILRENFYSFKLHPSYEEILSMPLENIRNLELTIENKFGKIEFLHPLDLEGVNLDSIRLDYFYFEISNVHSSSFEKLNKPCKVFLYTNEIKNDHDYIICLKKLREFYKRPQVNEIIF